MKRFFLAGLMCCVGYAVAQAEGEGTQLMCLGGTKTPRFEVQDIDWPATTEAATICLWKDDKVAACSLTIDDNCKPDLKWWLEMCEKYDLVVTHFLITERMSGKNVGFDGTWEDWKAFFATGRSSLQSHTRNHIRPSKTGEAVDLEDAYLGAIKDIEDNVPGARCMAMAAPYGESDRELVMANFVANRGTYGTPNVANMTDYASTAVGGLTQSYLDAILTGETTGEPKWLNRKRYYRGWIVPLFHYVKSNVVEGPVPLEENLKALDANKDKLWVGFFVDVARYGQERDTATLNVEVLEESVRLLLTDRMKDEYFDVPLTVKVRLPEGWNAVKAVQAKKAMAVRVVEHEGARFALVECVPDRGVTEITRL